MSHPGHIFQGRLYAASFGAQLGVYKDSAGLKDVTIMTFPDAGRTLVRSPTGYEDDPSLPERMVVGYPEVMIRWLNVRGFAK
jgi:hypothetical protein